MTMRVVSLISGGRGARVGVVDGEAVTAAYKHTLLVHATAIITGIVDYESPSVLVTVNDKLLKAWLMPLLFEEDMAVLATEGREIRPNHFIYYYFIIERSKNGSSEWVPSFHSNMVRVTGEHGCNEKYDDRPPLTRLRKMSGN